MPKKTLPLTPRQKSVRRQAILDELARMITNGQIETWRKFETHLKQAYEANQIIKVTIYKATFAKTERYISG